MVFHRDSRSKAESQNQQRAASREKKISNLVPVFLQVETGPFWLRSRNYISPTDRPEREVYT